MAPPPPLSARLTRKKPVAALLADASGKGGDGHSALGRSITLFQLTMVGVGATIGTGIFFVLAQQVPKAGPAVIIAFLLAAIAAGLTALCYAELSSMIPVSGSSYSYAYATIGEGVAFFVASCLILEYGISTAAVSVGWGEYIDKLIANLTGINLPYEFTHGPITIDPDNIYSSLQFGGGGIINLPAVLLVLMCCILLLRGTRESVRANTIMVIIKLAVLAMFIALTIGSFSAENMTPFAPHGIAGIGAAAGSIFFTFVGLDNVSTAGEEVVNPKRTLPLAIIFALIIVTGFYIMIALSALGVQPSDQFKGQEAGLATILETITGRQWPANVLAAGAVVSIFSITLITLYGQTRILFAMSRDGMLPPILHRVDPRSMTPTYCTIVATIFIAVIAAFVPADLLWDLTSMGTLIAFTVVSIAVIILRIRQPDMPRGFKVPFYPVLPALSIISCLYLISQLHWTVFAITAIWMLIAGTFYFTYSMRHSRLERGYQQEGAAE